MKKAAFIFAVLVACNIFVFGQTNSDKVFIHKRFLGYDFYNDGKKVNMFRLDNVLISDKQAYRYLKAGQFSRIFSVALAGLGGGLVGYPFGIAAAGKKPEWGYAQVGAGLILVSLFLEQVALHQAVKAVVTYNDGLLSTSHWKPKEIKLLFSPNIIGLAVGF